MKVDRALFHGQVTHGGEPVQGILELTRRSETNRERVRTETDEDGQFSVPIRTPGVFTAKVIVRERNLFALVPDVRLGTPSEEIRIELPEGRLSGVVVDSQGSGVEGARVAAEQVREFLDRKGPSGTFAESLTTRVVSRGEGRFEIEALSPGEWSLQAFSNDERSRVTSVQLVEGEIREGLVLRLDGEGVRGRLLDPGGDPIPDGAGRAAFLPPNGPTSEVLRFRSGETGEFELRYPGLEELVVNLAVNAPGHPAFALRRQGADMIDIRAPVAGGTVELATEGNRWSGLALNQLALVGEQGEYLQLSLLRDRMDEVDGGVVIHGLAVGSWNLVRTQSLRDVRALASGFGRELPALVSFEVGAGERVEVPIPPSDGDTSRQPEGDGPGL